MTTLPVLGAGITVLFFERQFGYSGLLGIGLDSAGDPVIFQHLFWFFGHPEVYVIVLPAFGIVSASLENIRLAPTPSYLGMVLALFFISFVGFFVWAHHCLLWEWRMLLESISLAPHWSSVYQLLLKFLPGL